MKVQFWVQPNSLAKTLLEAKNSFKIFELYPGEELSSDITELHYGHAKEYFRAAESAYRKAKYEDAWSYLYKSAWSLGYLSGLGDAKFKSCPEASVANQMRRNQQKASRAKFKNAEELRDAFAKALIAEAPQGKWSSKEKFDLNYDIVRERSFPEFPDTDYQRAKIMKREDILASLAQKKQR